MTAISTSFDTICFDCDSTLSRIEGIDELARRAGVLEEIAPLTSAAMDGGVALDEIYGKRLLLMRPDVAAMEWLAARYIEQMVLGAVETVRSLVTAGKKVHVISGGLKVAILPLAKVLGIEDENVHAVGITFDPAGCYKDFDVSSPLVTPKGKAAVCAQIGRYGGRIAMVGDGLTDVAAKGAGAVVVGFGGVVRRDIVVAQADYYVDAPDLRATLDILLTEKERAANS